MPTVLVPVHLQHRPRTGSARESWQGQGYRTVGEATVTVAPGIVFPGETDDYVIMWPIAYIVNESEYHCSKNGRLGDAKTLYRTVPLEGKWASHEFSGIRQQSTVRRLNCRSTGTFAAPTKRNRERIYVASREETKGKQSTYIYNGQGLSVPVRQIRWLIVYVMDESEYPVIRMVGWETLQ